MDWKKMINKTATYVFCGVAAVQIVLGAIWLCCQFPHMQNWQETYEYLDISCTWVLDEYVSFLYPALLKVCTGVEALAGIPFYVPVYVVQLLVAVLADLFFVRKVLKLEGSRAYMAAGYLVSFPVLLQFHMSVRPESLAVSGVLLLLSILESGGSRAEGNITDNEPSEKKIACGKKMGRTVCNALLTMALIWLMPDIIVICVVIWALYLLKCIHRARKQGKLSEYLKTRGFWSGWVAFVLALVISLSVNALIQTPGSRGRIQKTFWAAAFQRVVTDYFSRSYAMWDDEVRTTFTIEEAMEQAKRSDNMMYVVGPMLEADWGKERANQLYRQMTLDCFRVRTKEVVYQIRDDLVDSVLMPFSTWWQDDGVRRSQTGWNYGRFREAAPKISSFYWTFSMCSLLALVLTGLVCEILHRKRLHFMSTMILPALLQCTYSVMSSGQAVNYATILFVVLFWCTFALNIVICRNEKDVL